MKNNATEVRRKQALIRSRVFELQYGLDGLEDVYQYNSPLQYITLTHPVPVVHNNGTGINNGSSSGISSNSNKVNTHSAGAAVGSEDATGTHAAPEKEIIYTTRTGTGKFKNAQMVIQSHHKSNWPKDEKTGLHQRDAFDIVVDYFLGWHSGTVPDVRNATVPECWDGWLDKKMNRCRPGKDPSGKKSVGLCMCL